MRYCEFQKESERFEAQRRAIVRMEEREWFLGDMIVRLHIHPVVHADPCGDITVSVTASRCYYQQGARTSYYDQRPAGHLDDVATDRNTGEMCRFSADQLHRIAECKALAERWVTGLIDDLPQQAPDSIQRRPLPGRP